MRRRAACAKYGDYVAAWSTATSFCPFMQYCQLLGGFGRRRRQGRLRRGLVVRLDANDASDAEIAAAMRRPGPTWWNRAGRTLQLQARIVNGKASTRHYQMPRSLLPLRRVAGELRARTWGWRKFDFGWALLLSQSCTSRRFWPASSKALGRRGCEPPRVLRGCWHGAAGSGALPLDQGSDDHFGLGACDDALGGGDFYFNDRRRRRARPATRGRPARRAAERRCAVAGAIAFVNPGAAARVPGGGGGAAAPRGAERRVAAPGRSGAGRLSTSAS